MNKNRKKNLTHQSTLKNKKSTAARINLSTIIQTTAVALGALASSTSLYANDCTWAGTNDLATPTSGNDQIYCKSGTVTNFNGLGGEDKLYIINENGNVTLDGAVSFGSGNDEFQVSNAYANGSISLLSSASVSMGAGKDFVNLVGNSNYTIQAPINLGADDDTLEVTRYVTIDSDIHGDDGNDYFFIGNTNIYDNGNSIINGNIYGDTGNDTFILNNKDVSINGILDGGNGDDNFRLQLGSASLIKGGSGDDSIDIYGTFSYGNSNFKIDGGENNDSVRFIGVRGSFNAENITNVESIIISNSYDSTPVPSSVTFLGNQLTLSEATTNIWKPGVFIDVGNELKFNSNIFTITGGPGLENAGILNLRGSAPGKTLFLNGNYIGQQGSSILLNTNLGGDNSLTDRMVIIGNTSGQSKIFVNNVSGKGAKTINGINLIEVQGSSNANFTLGAPLQVGSWEYFLYKKGKDWNLESTSGGDNNSISPTPTATPTLTPSSLQSFTNSPAPSPKIYRPAVAGYLQVAQTQFDQNASLIGTLEQRQASSNNTGDIWARLISDKTIHKTSTFGYQQSSQTLQFGKDIIDTANNKQDKGTQTKAGITVGLGMQSSNYFDQNRTFTSAGINTGASETNEFALGAYYTQRNDANPYMDLQAHLMGSRTQFKDIYDGSAKQTGLGVAVSAELGKDIALANSGLKIIPQAQAIYQNHNYSNFNDGTSDVAKQSAESLRVRAGITLQSNKAKGNANDKTSTTHWNASLNLWQEVLDNPNRTIAGNVVHPDNSQKPWLELGLGVNHAITETSSLSAQISHKRSISGNQQSGNSVNLAYRIKW